MFVEHNHSLSTNKHIEQMMDERVAKNEEWWIGNVVVVDGSMVVDCDVVVNVTNITFHSSSSSSSLSSSSNHLSSSSDGFAIKVVIEFGNGTNVSAEEIKQEIIKLVGEDIGALSVVIEKDSGGNVIVTVATENQDAANTIVEAIEQEQSKGNKCTTDLLCRATEVRLVEREPSGASSVHLDLMTVVLLTACALLAKHHHHCD